MALQKPNDPDQTNPPEAPDTARSYERAKPEKEAGQGRLDNNASTPSDAPDRAEGAVKNQHPPRGITAEETSAEHRDGRALNGGGTKVGHDSKGRPLPSQPDHSMLEEEPTGWDQAPQDIHDPRLQRHPRTPATNKGGTP